VNVLEAEVRELRRQVFCPDQPAPRSDVRGPGRSPGTAQAARREPPARSHDPQAKGQNGPERVRRSRRAPDPHTDSG
jgi:hypothetical protein